MGCTIQSHVLITELCRNPVLVAQAADRAAMTVPTTIGLGDVTVEVTGERAV
jgi:hypothetical protein